MYDDLLVLVHPWVAPTFVSVVDPEWSSRMISEHVARDVDLVIGNRAQWHIRYEFVGTGVVLGKRVDRILVSCIPEATLSIAKIVGAPRSEVKSSIAVIAGLVSSQDVGHQDLHGPSGITTAIGFYGNRIEVSIHQAGSLRFSGFLENINADTAFPQLDTLLSSTGVQQSQITRVVLYGHLSDGWDVSKADMFSHARIDRLNPSDIFGPTSRKITHDSAYVPVAAGAFNRLLSNV